MAPNSHADADDGARQPLLAAQLRGEQDDMASHGASQPPSGADQEQGTFSRNLGAGEAFAIIISIVVGSGIFTSPGAIDTNVPSPGAALIVWLVGGMLAWTGASTLAELGTAIPGEGGVQPYLRYVFGDLFGFLAAWTWVVAVMPATLAILGIVFVESIFSAAGVTDRAGHPTHKLLSVLVVAAAGAANSISTRASTRLNGFFVATKFAAILGVVAAGLVVMSLQLASPDREDVGGRDWFTRPWFGYRTTVKPDGGTVDWADVSGWDMLGHYSAALYGALWAYSGWDKAIYISAELSAPARQLPLAIDTAIPTIILCFITANAAYYIMLPWKIVSTTDSVAVTAISRLQGPTAGILAAVLICLVVAGSLLGNSFVAGRMAVAAANRRWLPRLFGVVGRAGVSSRPSAPDGDGSPDAVKEPRSDAPVNALILSTAVSALFICLGNFRALLTFNGLGEYSFFFLTVLGAIVLRFRQPDLHRPYKPLVVVPLVFAVVSGFVAVRGAVFAPVQALVLVVVWIIGILYYWVTASRRERAGENPS